MGKPSTASKNRYNTGAYDRLFVFVPKGKKAAIKEFAASNAESVNGFINRAIDEALERGINESNIGSR